MARGWESKSIEQQQAEREDQSKPARPPLSSEEQERNRKYQGLLLARERLRQQIEVARNPRHQQMLQRAISDLEAQLADFE
jgi:hypothetical protein